MFMNPCQIQFPVIIPVRTYIVRISAHPGWVYAALSTATCINELRFEYKAAFLECSASIYDKQRSRQKCPWFRHWVLAVCLRRNRPWPHSMGIEPAAQSYGCMDRMFNQCFPFTASNIITPSEKLEGVSLMPVNAEDFAKEMDVLCQFMAWAFISFS